MRLTLCNEVIKELPFAQQCALTASLGYDGIEIAPFTLDLEAPHRLPAARKAEIRRMAMDQGLPITSLHWLLVSPKGLSITTDDTALRGKTLDMMQGLIELAAELGAQVLVHGSPGARQVVSPGDAARAEDAMLRAGTWAAAAGVVYCLEPLAAAETSWCTTVAEGVAIVERINNPALRTMLDVCAAGNGEAEAVTTLLDRWLPTGLLAHIHLNDRNRRAPGQGADRFGPILATLHRHGYAGLCGVEPFEYHPDGPTCAARAIGYLRGLQQSFA